MAITGPECALAQDGRSRAEQTTELNEIVVMARKREESLQSVPVAVTSQSGAQLEQLHITVPNDLGRVVPSLQIRSSTSLGSVAQIALRGQFASDVVLGMSQPVGLYEDTVNIPHPVGANNAFFDLERVEVLKGPQGTLYGRNTTAGAINVITRNADHNGVHGFAEGEIGNYESWRVGGAVNVPVIPDVLAVRLAYQHWNREGFGKSIVTGQRLGEGHDDDIFRLSARFDPTSNFTASLKLEHGKMNFTGAMIASRSLGAPVEDSGLPPAAQIATSPNIAYVNAALWASPANQALLFQSFGGDRTAFHNLLAAGQAVLAPCIGGSLYENCSATHVFDRVKTWHGVLDWSWDITDAVRLRSITGVHEFTDTAVYDLDSVQPQLLEIGFGSDGLRPAPTIRAIDLPFDLPADQRSQQWSQEFNLSGDAFDDRLSWLVGAYGSWDKGKQAQQAGVLEEFATVALGAPLLFGQAGLSNTNDTWAVFTQNDVKFSDVFSVTFGARYTKERLGQHLAAWNYNSLSGTFSCSGALPNGTAVPFIPADPTRFEGCADNVLATGPDGLFTTAKFRGTSYLLSFNFQLTRDKLLYVKTARGFRGGAFGRSLQPPAKPEIATDYEVGLKADWLERRLRTNFAVFQTNYDNKQVSSAACIGGEAPPCGPAGSTVVLNNAASARIRGAEFEFQAVPMHGLSIYGGASWIEAKYLSWPNAVTGSGAPFGDAAGIDIAIGPGGMPHWQGSVGARYEFPIASGIAAAQLDYAYRGRSPLTPLNSDPFTPVAVLRDVSQAVGLVNARLEYKREDLGLTGSIWVSNLTDEEYGFRSIGASLTNGITNMIVQPPRMWGVTIRKTFGDE
jgi:iron complex outermembrane receptor protein